MVAEWVGGLVGWSGSDSAGCWVAKSDYMWVDSKAGVLAVELAASSVISKVAVMVVESVRRLADLLAIPKEL